MTLDIDSLRRTLRNGYVGTATITTGNTTATVTHFMGETPHITVTPLNEEGKNPWVSARSPTSFTISISAPQLVDCTYSYEVR